MSTIAFFVFEMMSYLLENDDDRMCFNTSTAKIMLSSCVLLGVAIPVVMQTVPKDARDEVAMPKER